MPSASFSALCFGDVSRLRDTSNNPLLFHSLYILSSCFFLSLLHFFLTRLPSLPLRLPILQWPNLDSSLPGYLPWHFYHSLSSSLAFPTKNQNTVYPHCDVITAVHRFSLIHRPYARCYIEVCLLYCAVIQPPASIMNKHGVQLIKRCIMGCTEYWRSTKDMWNQASDHDARTGCVFTCPVDVHLNDLVQVLVIAARVVKGNWLWLHHVPK